MVLLYTAILYPFGPCVGVLEMVTKTHTGPNALPVLAKILPRESGGSGVSQMKPKWMYKSYRHNRALAVRAKQKPVVHTPCVCIVLRQRIVRVRCWRASPKP